MAKVFIEETTLTNIGNAIREKTGKTALIDPAVMHTEIASITTGGGGEDDTPTLLTGNCTYRFTQGAWNWYIEKYKDKITTADITNISYMFHFNSDITDIPFQINLNNCTDASYCLSHTNALTMCPKIRGTFNWSKAPSLNMFNSNYASSIPDLEELFTPEMLDGFSTVNTAGTGAVVLAGLPCIRRVPTWYYKFRLNPSCTKFPTASQTAYYSGFNGCYVLDEVLNMPVWYLPSAPSTGNMFTSFSKNCSRLSRFTFETQNDNTPIAVNWKSQTIDFSSNVGSVSGTSSITKYATQHGIDASKQVTSDATYQALKNDPDWWTADIKYSRYNHDSAVETINSLPDTSTYLASAGGTNTIKFKGAAGSATDGGAINTLTAEEIAVATAKGWTVTLV